MVAGGGAAAAQGSGAPVAVAVGKVKGGEVVVEATSASPPLGQPNLAVELIAKRPGGALEVDRLSLRVAVAAKAVGSKVVVDTGKELHRLGTVSLQIKRAVKVKEGCGLVGAAGKGAPAKGSVVLRLPGKVGRLVVRDLHAAYATLQSPVLPTGCPQEGPRPAPPLRCPAPPTLFATGPVGGGTLSLYAVRKGRRTNLALYLHSETPGRSLQRDLFLKLPGKAFQAGAGKARLVLPKQLAAVARGRVAFEPKRLGGSACPTAGVVKGKVLAKPLVGGAAAFKGGGGLFAG